MFERHIGRLMDRTRFKESISPTQKPGHLERKEARNKINADRWCWIAQLQIGQKRLFGALIARVVRGRLQTRAAMKGGDVVTYY